MESASSHSGSMIHFQELQNPECFIWHYLKEVCVCVRASVCVYMYVRVCVHVRTDLGCDSLSTSLCKANLRA